MPPDWEMSLAPCLIKVPPRPTEVRIVLPVDFLPFPSFIPIVILLTCSMCFACALSLTYCEMHKRAFFCIPSEVYFLYKCWPKERTHNFVLYSKWSLISNSVPEEITKNNFVLYSNWSSILNLPYDVWRKKVWIFHSTKSLKLLRPKAKAAGTQRLNTAPHLNVYQRLTLQKSSASCCSLLLERKWKV